MTDESDTRTPMDEPPRLGVGVVASVAGGRCRCRRLFVRYAHGFDDEFRWSDGINGYTWDDLVDPEPAS